jgi:O-antigen/teichoic acid export membrane protein
LRKIRELSKNSAIYGVGDVAVQVVNFLLLRVYVEYLSKSDYGVLALLGAVEAAAKLFFRWGLDAAFMRYWYDCSDTRARQRLASTIFFYLLAANGVLAVAAISASPFISPRFLGEGRTLALQLVLLNTFAIGFTFIPFHVLRIENRPGVFSALTLARSVLTVVLRLVLVVGFRQGVMGIVVTDVVVTALLVLLMARWFAPLIRPLFSRDLLRTTLGFGLPRIPHGLALQVMAVGDRFILEQFRSLAEVGVYSIGVSIGLIPKIALGAFEYAWAPFYYETSREPDGRKVFTTVTTYGIAALGLMTAGLSAIAPDLLDVVTNGRFVSAAPVVGWTALGVFFYGVYLLTSIGLNITSHSSYYPVSTAIGAGVNLTLNLALIPGYGMLGAAWANAAAYAVQSAVAYRFSRRFYPIPYEAGRISRAVAAALLGYVAARLVPDMPSIPAVLVRGTTVVAVTGGALWLTGFFNAAEIRHLKGIGRRPRRATVATSDIDATEMAGGIVSVDVPDELIHVPEQAGDGPARKREPR